jgi:hypothetical protein
MDDPRSDDKTNNISMFMVGVVALAIIIIATLTVTAIWAGPPAV